MMLLNKVQSWSSFPKTGGSWMLLSVAVVILCVHVLQICGQTNFATCGKTKGNMMFAIMKGLPAEPGSWPWHATIYRKLTNESEYICGGSIIDKHTILTAAHCVLPSTNSIGLSPDQVSVHVGRVNMSEPIENVQVMQVANIVIHPEFRPANGSNDIAIVRLSSDIDFTHSVRPVCIWDGEDDVNHIVGSSGTMIGFGLNEEYRGSETLQEATVTVVNHLNCLLKDPHTYAEVLNHNMFCAGAKNNVSACNGDSGGGLFFNIHGTWYLRGIVSSIPGLRDGTRMFCDFTKYTIFTDVSKFRTWILRFTNTAKWLNELKPCQDSVIDENTMCNAAYRHDHGFLVFGIDKYVHRISLSDGQHIRTVENFAGFTVDIKPDCAEGRLYMKNSMNAFIYSMNYDGTDKRIFKSTRSSLSLAVDWISRRLYWSEIFQRTIHVARLDNPDVRTVLLTNVVAYTIAIDPHQGKLYWASVKDFIEWSNLDGTDRQVLIKLQRVTPYILISMSTGELCHSGVYTKIECIDTRTKRTHAVVKSNTVSHFPNLAITEKHLYWTEYPCDKNEIKHIKRMDSSGVQQTFMNFTAKIGGPMAVVPDTCPIFHSQCAINNGGCRDGTICLLSPREPSGRTCKQIET